MKKKIEVKQHNDGFISVLINGDTIISLRDGFELEKKHDKILGVLYEIKNISNKRFVGHIFTK